MQTHFYAEYSDCSNLVIANSSFFIDKKLCFIEPNTIDLVYWSQIVELLCCTTKKQYKNCLGFTRLFLCFLPFFLYSQ